MSALKLMKARLEELRTEDDGLLAQRAAVIDKAITEARGMTEGEKALHDDVTTKRAAVQTQIDLVTQRIAELDAQEAREAAAALIRTQTGVTGEVGGGGKVVEKPVYQRGDRSVSYWRDLAQAQLFGERGAADRIQRHGRQMEDTPEFRALGNTNTTGGSGGEFAPPLWAVEDYVKLPRAGRAVANIYNHMDVPFGVSSINLPKVLTGATTAIQSTQNTALSQTDITTGSVGTGFSTIGGKQVVAQQLLDQSEIDFDQVLNSDLAADFVRQEAAQIWVGAGTGVNNNSVINGLINAVVPAANQLTLTTATPTAFYSKAAGMLSAFATNRFDSPTHWIMHPRRWFWLLAQVDSTGRPLVVPTPYAFNPLGTVDGNNYAGIEGPVGVFMGLPVIIDPLAPTNISGTQDTVLLVKADDLWLLESPVRAEVMREPYGDSLGVLYRIYGYVGTILNRQTSSISTMNGAGLIAPVF